MVATEVFAPATLFVCSIRRFGLCLRFWWSRSSLGWNGRVSIIMTITHSFRLYLPLPSLNVYLTYSPAVNLWLCDETLRHHWLGMTITSLGVRNFSHLGLDVQCRWYFAEYVLFLLFRLFFSHLLYLSSPSAPIWPLISIHSHCASAKRSSQITSLHLAVAENIRTLLSHHSPLYTILSRQFYFNYLL